MSREPLIFGSVCSGIEAASVAWHPLGWRASFVSEIEPFPRAVLSHHYPETALHGDFTTIKDGEYSPIDLLVGGTPCQSFSVAGLRGGLADDRGNLALEYLRLADRLRPRWLVWENVPGVLSSDGGRDFGAILGGMVELGYGFAYRVLDAQFFGVAQRRRRVFVVGHLGDWRCAAAVLFERHSLQGHSAPRREAREGAAPSPSLRARANSSHRADSQAFIPDVGYSLNAHGGRQDAESETLIAHTLKGVGFDASEDGTGRGIPLVCDTLTSNGDAHSGFRDEKGLIAIAASQPIVLMERGRNGSPNLEYRQDGTANAILTPNGGRGGLGVGAVAFNITPSNSNKDYNARPSDRAQAITSAGNRPSARGGDLIATGVTIHGTDGTATAASMTEVAGSIRTKPPGSVENSSTTAALHGSAVRRLTPRECERLQGFPDDYTLIPWRNGMASDGPRYKALGNSMAVPVMAWIGRRIQAVEDLKLRTAEAA
jgi:DNA (cytosine-5)-methyltransferase 1